MQESLFDNTKNAFKLKSDKELKKAHFIFSMMGKQWLVNIGSSLTMMGLKLNLPIKSLVRHTVFEQFCGGTSEEECMPLVSRMYNEGVSSILDYSVEGKEDEADFDKVVQKKIKLIELASNEEALPYEVIKPTGIGRFKIWQLVSENAMLSSDEQAEWQRIKERVDLLCRTAAEQKTALLYDGEESWMQDAADQLLRDMMAKYNKDTVVIYNTVQCYRHDRLDYITDLYNDALKNNFKIGVKIVRGAYMEKERKRANQLNYESPICIDKPATDVMFNSVMEYCLDKLEIIKVCLGTHNEESTLAAMDILKKKEIAYDDKDVWFGQLYGMSDNLTYNLAALGFNSFKILPFGPVKEVMPYLIRRAQENTSVAGQVGRELSLIKSEMQRRGI